MYYAQGFSAATAAAARRRRPPPPPAAAARRRRPPPPPAAAARRRRPPPPRWRLRHTRREEEAAEEAAGVGILIVLTAVQHRNPLPVLFLQRGPGPLAPVAHVTTRDGGLHDEEASVVNDCDFGLESQSESPHDSPPGVTVTPVINLCESVLI
jgi:hypothetical protein